MKKRTRPPPTTGGTGSDSPSTTHRSYLASGLLDHPIEIRPGMTFALETQNGKLHDHGVRLEEMLYVTDTGIEMVTTYKCHEIIATA